MTIPTDMSIPEKACYKVLDTRGLNFMGKGQTIAHQMLLHRQAGKSFVARRDHWWKKKK